MGREAWQLRSSTSSARGWLTPSLQATRYGRRPPRSAELSGIALRPHTMHPVIHFQSRLFDVAREPENPINPIRGTSLLEWLRAHVPAHLAMSAPKAKDWGRYSHVDWRVQSRCPRGRYRRQHDRPALDAITMGGAAREQHHQVNLDESKKFFGGCRIAVVSFDYLALDGLSGNIDA